MKNIFKELDRYKLLASSFQASEILKVAEVQHKLLENSLIKSSVIESALKHQRQLKEMIGVKNLNSLTAIRPELFQLSVLNSNLNSILNQKSKINNLLSLAERRLLFSQGEVFFKEIDSSTYKIIQQEQNRLKIALAKTSSINAFAFESLRLNKLINIQLSNNLSWRYSLLNSSTFESFRTSSQILSSIQTANSILKNVEFEKYEAIQSLRDSFSIKLLTEIKAEVINLNDAIEVIEEAFSRKIETTPKGLISFEGMLQIFLAFALYIISHYSDLESEKANMERMNQLETSFATQVALLLPEEENNVTFYIVKRTVNLRADHTTKSPILDILYPNQKVKLIKRNSKWIYVEFFDNLKGIPRLGWVYKKYLKMEK